MLLWVILPLAVYEQIQREGVYRNTDPEDEDVVDFPLASDWLNTEMTKKAGPAPEGAVAPIHGWLRWETERVRPDLRWMRWHWGPPGEYVLMRIDIPEDKVIFIDAEAWTCMLNMWLITDSEEEWKQLQADFDSLSPEEQEKMLRENWHRVFDIEYVEGDDWRGKGYEVEACFWEIRKEQIRSVKRFTSKRKKGW